jgi:hypothetical protein
MNYNLYKNTFGISFEKIFLWDILYRVYSSYDPLITPKLFDK